MVGLLNLLVDPYDRFDLNRLGTAIGADREFKGKEVQRFPEVMPSCSATARPR